MTRFEKCGIYKTSLKEDLKKNGAIGMRRFGFLKELRLFFFVSKGKMNRGWGGQIKESKNKENKNE